MWTCVLLLAAMVLAAVEGVCYNNEKYYYEELGCKPEATEGACPSSYDCSSLDRRSQDKCHYQGKEFDEGHVLENFPDSPCLVQCTCRTIHYYNRSEFDCISAECPDLFQPLPSKGCYLTYEHGRCCHVEEICEDSAQQRSVEPVCEYKGVSYKVGQMFYPDEEPCHECICQPGYKGEFVEPFCHKFPCNLELHYGNYIADGCVPVYYGEKRCCPIGWRCPEPTDSVEASERNDSKSANGTAERTDSVDASEKNDLKSTNATGKTCKFGGLTMHIGDKFSSSSDRNKGRECMCRVPPHPVCVQKESA